MSENINSLQELASVIADELKISSIYNSSFVTLKKPVGTSVILPGLLLNKLCINMINTNRSASTTELDFAELRLIPKVTKRKNIDSSKGLLTGCLNLTIDKAPTIPNDNAILPEIDLVMMNEMLGKRKQVNIKL